MRLRDHTANAHYRLLKLCFFVFQSCAHMLTVSGWVTGHETCWRSCCSGDCTETIPGKLESLHLDEGSGKHLSLPSGMMIIYSLCIRVCVRCC